jgi:hypothetical protein
MNGTPAVHVLVVVGQEGGGNLNYPGGRRKRLGWHPTPVFLIHPITLNDDETLPNFIKRKHPSKQGRGKETRGKDQSPGKKKNSPKEVGSQGGKGTTKYRNFHQDCRISTKEKGDKPNKTPSQKEPSLPVTAFLEMKVAWALCKASVYKMNTTLLKGFHLKPTTLCAPSRQQLA